MSGSGHREEAPQASKLLGYLLERADHQDREAVVLAYNLYQISLRENYGTAESAAPAFGGRSDLFGREKRNEDEGILRRRECGRIGRSGLKRAKSEGYVGIWIWENGF